MKIRKLGRSETAPMHLLLLADPSIEFIEDYIIRGNTYVADINGSAVGVYILLDTSPGTSEIVNIAVDERYQGGELAENL